MIANKKFLKKFNRIEFAIGDYIDREYPLTYCFNFIPALFFKKLTSSYVLEFTWLFWGIGIRFKTNEPEY
jgi:hypothetical protein